MDYTLKFRELYEAKESPEKKAKWGAVKALAQRLAPGDTIYCQDYTQTQAAWRAIRRLYGKGTMTMVRDGQGWLVTFHG